MCWLKFPGATKAHELITFTIGKGGAADSFTLDPFEVFTRVKQ